MPQILSDFIVNTAKGYYCPYGDFYIDPSEAVPQAVISHAHGDHARPGHLAIYATAMTVAFMRHRFSKQPLATYRIKGFGQEFKLGDVSLCFLPAGHILGSAQVLMTYRGCKYLYTGDFKRQEDPTCEPLENVAADVLITETTFANPEVVHPDPVAEIKKLSSTAHNIMLGCYGLGKAQRLTHLINQYCPEKTVYVHHNILPIHRLYDAEGFVKLDYKIYERKVMRDGQHKIYMVPPMTFNNYFRATNVLRVFASGWQRLQRHNDMALYISDHVDWSDLLYVIEQVKPQEIWTIHGDGHYLRQYFAGRLTVRDLLSPST